MEFFSRCLLAIIILHGPGVFAKEKLMILINPDAGSGQAPNYYERQVKPFLSKKYELKVFQSRNPEIAKLAIEQAGEELLSYAGIIGLGGDGTIHKIDNALWESQYSLTALENIPIGHVPFGSGNALARSMWYQSCKEDDGYSPEALLEGIMAGETTPLDLWSFETDTKKSGIFFLGISYGIISYIDIESEKLRWPFGSLRFDIYGGYRWLLNESFDARLLIKTGALYEEITGPFREIWCVNIPYASEKVCVAPNAHSNDGLLHTMVLKTKEASWPDMLKFLIKLGSNDVHKLPFVNMYVGNEFRLKLDGNAYLTIDGEPFRFVKELFVEKLPVKGKIFRAQCSSNARAKL
jgi:diacylglycerol kinase family enzyme